MKYRFLSYLFSVVSLVGISNLSAQTKQTAPKTNTPAGFIIGKNGLHYKIVKKGNSGQKASLTDILTLNLNYGLYKGPGKDSIMFDSRKIPQQELMVQLNPTNHKGDIMEGLALIEVGDSATFIAPADSFFLKTAGAAQLPPGIKKGDKLIFQVGFKKLATVAQLMAEKAELDSIAQIQEGENLTNYLQEKNITEKPSASGLIIQIIEQGKGEKPQNGQEVTVHYTGYLLNGNKFDSSVDRGQPFSFKLGQGMVIKGWDEGIAELNVGTKAKLIIPSSIGYGAQGAGANIPPFSTLIFEVELIKAE